MPIVLTVALLVVDGITGPGFLTIIGLGALMYGAVPYVILAVGLLVWSRGRSERQLRLAALVAPLLFAPWPGLLYLALGRRDYWGEGERPSFWTFATSEWGVARWVELAVISLVAAYVCVGLVFLGLLIVKDTARGSEPRAAAPN